MKSDDARWIAELMVERDRLRDERDDFYNFLNDLCAEAAYDMPDDTRTSILGFLRRTDERQETSGSVRAAGRNTVKLPDVDTL